MKIQIFCNYCGSKDVRRNADVKWNEEKQEWEIVSLFDDATCEACKGDTTLAEIEVGKPIPTKTCRKCGSNLDKNGHCSDETCPFSDRGQNEAYTIG